MKHKLDNKGISLALTIGLMLLLVTMTATINELVIRALRASHQIEASDKSYFAAEAGIEDALYELSAHSAGYETSVEREADFTQNVSWDNEWTIENRALNDCNLMDSWEIGYLPTYCGRVFEGQKLLISLSTDDATDAGLSVNQINETAPDVNKMSINAINLRLRLPHLTVDENDAAFAGAQALHVDNDGDYNTTTGLGLNEDGVLETSFCGGPVELDDGDCDNREDEDSEEDPVLLWKVIDSSNNAFQPLRGCVGDAPHASHPGEPNAILCEKNFTRSGDEVYVEFDETARGFSTLCGTPNDICDLGTFMTNVAATDQMQLELQIIAPFIAIDPGNRVRVPIPHWEYGVEYDAGIGVELPATFFSIKSDGYYRDFKQSITTNVSPRTSTRLLDLTIIQQ